MSCAKAQGYLERQALAPHETTDAKKEKKGRAEALKLAKAADTVVVGKGKKVVVFDMKKDPPDDATLLANILGPTGNLKAPTIRAGKTLLVGYGEEAYQQVLGR